METVAVKATEQLFERGILGLVCLILLAVCAFFYIEKRRVEKRERELYERHLAKSDEWVRQYNTLATQMESTLDTALRRLG